MGYADKLGELKKIISAKDSLLVAYSGGVDSSLLAKVAKDVLGDEVLCVILDSETLPRSELMQAGKLAEDLGLRFQTERIPILKSERFRKNPVDRCYVCKKLSFRALKNIAVERGISCVADGLNLSDYDDFRPGIKASNEEGIWHPFVEAGISKADIREICKMLELPFWDKPSSACLSSRVPYGEEINEDNLLRIELSEDFLKSLGIRPVRVRAHGKLSRLEVSPIDLERVMHSRDLIIKKLKSLGFIYITLDLEGFRSGSMNEAI